MIVLRFILDHPIATLIVTFWVTMLIRSAIRLNRVSAEHVSPDPIHKDEIATALTAAIVVGTILYLKHNAEPRREERDVTPKDDVT